MEAVEEEVAPPPPVPNNKDLSPAIAKGKRTKRHRPHSPIPFTISPPPAVDAATNNRLSPSISAASSEESTTTEEVDTARCLLLLSQGYFSKHDPQIPKLAAAAAARAAGGGPCVYTCKTCNRSFSSFQALGGHRASHKKPKNDKKSAIFSDEEDFPSPTMSSSKNRISSNSLSLQLSNISTTTFSATPKSSPSPRIHECSYCGAEFTSGQALGGHMRKHRAGPVARSSPTIDEPEPEPEPEASKKPKNGLSLDLNLPAPEDENQKFGLGPKREKSPQEKNEAAAGLVLSTTTTPSLVDCHY